MDGSGEGVRFLKPQGLWISPGFFGGFLALAHVQVRSHLPVSVSIADDCQENGHCSLQKQKQQNNLTLSESNQEINFF